MQIRAIMFDLDGTLADTLDDIAAAGNHMLREMGRPPQETQRYRFLAGQGAEWLVREALETDDAAKLERGLELFRHHYHEHRHELTRPFPGIAEMLDALVAKDITLAVLSNKPHPFTLQVMRDKFGRWPFDIVHGAKPEVPLKPDPGAAIAIVKESGIAPEHWLYVGDTSVDMDTANGAGLFAVGVTWGFRTEEELRQHGAKAIVHHPNEITAMV